MFVCIIYLSVIHFRCTKRFQQRWYIFQSFGNPSFWIAQFKPPFLYYSDQLQNPVLDRMGCMAVLQDDRGDWISGILIWWVLGKEISSWKRLWRWSWDLIMLLVSRFITWCAWQFVFRLWIFCKHRWMLARFGSGTSFTMLKKWWLKSKKMIHVKCGRDLLPLFMYPCTWMKLARVSILLLIFLL